ncbi:uncharacterized protein ACBT57_022611 [Dama dama]
MVCHFSQCVYSLETISPTPLGRAPPGPASKPTSPHAQNQVPFGADGRKESRGPTTGEEGRGAELAPHCRLARLGKSLRPPPPQGNNSRREFAGLGMTLTGYRSVPGGRDFRFLSLTEYIMRNTGLEEAQAGIKIVRRNINNLRYADDTIANICWIIEKAREFQKNIYFCFIDWAKAFDCADHNKLWKILKEMGIPDHLTCLLRNLYAGQEATVRTGYGTPDWFQIGKGICQGCILSPCLFNLYAEYIMRNAGLDEAQAGMKIAGRNINNFRYADDTTLMAESEEELKSLLMKVKEESEKVGLSSTFRKLRSWDPVPSLYAK